MPPAFQECRKDITANNTGIFGFIAVFDVSKHQTILTNFILGNRKGKLSCLASSCTKLTDSWNIIASVARNQSATID